MSAEEVEIVGAGPVGLFAALSALESGLRPIVYERRTEARAGSRSIGIHPPSLELLERLGLAGAFLERGVRVERGIAFGERGVIGAVDFESCFGRHRYVLSIPQVETERILREALEQRAAGCVLAGHDFDPMQRVQSEAVALVACDGKHSPVRRAAGIVFDGGPYDGSYAMGDFPDTTSLEAVAAVFLGRGGLVESFPLPGSWRRWVIRRRHPTSDAASAEELAETVRDRTKYRLNPGDGVNLTSFRAERYLAATFNS
ncbi:MAG: FAD-dependent monooxygenase, partial [Myxococcales bacterium]|nr:FAD-dependent monooxygenase [Myxococcales bacterium]